VQRTGTGQPTRVLRWHRHTRLANGATLRSQNERPAEATIATQRPRARWATGRTLGAERSTAPSSQRSWLRTPQTPQRCSRHATADAVCMCVCVCMCHCGQEPAAGVATNHALSKPAVNKSSRAVVETRWVTNTHSAGRPTDPSAAVRPLNVSNSGGIEVSHEQALCNTVDESHRSIVTNARALRPKKRFPN
jgi:hypothetical protein